MQTATDKNYKFKRAATIKVPEEFFNPLRTGMKDVDDSWSEIGGIVPSQVTFITGPPGSGKTTLTLAIGSILTNAGDVGFISLEMSDFQLAHQARKIPGFEKVHVTSEFDQEETMKALYELKPKLVILDSIQKAARKMKDMPFDRAQFTIVNMFTKFAKDTWTPVFLIGHCDKNGNYKGPSDLLHDVDSHLLVNYDKKTEMRTFSFGKNRFGGVVQDSLFGITRDRVWVGTPYIETVFDGAVIEPTMPAPEVIPAGSVMACLRDLDVQWNGSTVRAAILGITSMLKAWDPEFEDRAIVKKSTKVKVQFRGSSLAHCHPKTGELVFGKKIFTDSLEIGKVGYAKEQKYLLPRVKTKSELLIWVIIHEWCHLYESMQHHKNEFFDLVAKKYDWFMTEARRKQWDNNRCRSSSRGTFHFKSTDFIFA